MSTRSWVIGGVLIAAAITLSRQKAGAEQKLRLTLSKSWLVSGHDIATRSKDGSVWRYRDVEYIASPKGGMWGLQSFDTLPQSGPYFYDYATELDAIKSAEYAIDQRYAGQS